MPSAFTDDDYNRLRRDLVRAVARICPAWLSAEHEDIAQAAMMRVTEIVRTNEWNTLPSSSYLWKAAFNATIDEIRRVRRRREGPMDEVVSERLAARGASPEREAAGRQLGLAIRGCLSSLLENRRLAVAATLHGHSVPEAARLLGWTTRKAENLVQRGLRDLRNCLRAKGIER